MMTLATIADSQLQIELQSGKQQFSQLLNVVLHCQTQNADVCRHDIRRTACGSKVFELPNMELRSELLTRPGVSWLGLPQTDP